MPSILPLPRLGGPTDPAERIDALCSSIHRLARFRPCGIVCLTGSGPGSIPTSRGRSSPTGCARSPREAELAGVPVALEPYQRDGGEDWTIATTIPEAVELIEAAGDHPSLQLQFDVWHLWNTPTLLDDIGREAGRFAGVHVSDVRRPTRSWADRVLPGDGAADVPAVLAALDEAGWEGCTTWRSSPTTARSAAHTKVRSGRSGRRARSPRPRRDGRGVGEPSAARGVRDATTNTGGRIE